MLLDVVGYTLSKNDLETHKNRVHMRISHAIHRNALKTFGSELIQKQRISN